MEISSGRLLLSMGSHHSADTVLDDSHSHDHVAFLKSTKRYRCRIVDDIRGVSSKRGICRAARPHDALLRQPGRLQFGLFHFTSVSARQRLYIDGRSQI